uniref:Regulator of G-protein signaling 20 n=1 Tax=Mus musculus TaxID=10090 RepID=E9Q1A3_MOUSE
MRTANGGPRARASPSASPADPGLPHCQKPRRPETPKSLP